MERLSEPLYISILDDLNLIKETWPLTKNNYGVQTFKELILFEITLPRGKALYEAVEDKKIFWAKVEQIEKALID